MAHGQIGIHSVSVEHVREDEDSTAEKRQRHDGAVQIVHQGRFMTQLQIQYADTVTETKTYHSKNCPQPDEWIAQFDHQEAAGEEVALVVAVVL